MDVLIFYILSVDILVVSVIIDVAVRLLVIDTVAGVAVLIVDLVAAVFVSLSTSLWFLTSWLIFLSQCEGFSLF